MGIPPTGKQFTMQGMNFFRIGAGKIVENWSSFDMFSLLQQLGVVPASGQAS
jgi:predicted ester cyclase